jgi:general secretion pathway protein C
MSRPWYVRREPELALLVASAALAAFGVTAALRLVADPLPTPEPAYAAPTPVAIEPLDAWAPIAARDIFNPPGAERGSDGSRRLVGVGFQGGEARAAIEDARTHRQDLVRVGDAVGDDRVSTIAWDHIVLTGAGGERVLALAPAPEGAPTESPEALQPDRQVVAHDATIRQTSATGFVVDRSVLQGAVGDMSGLMTQLRAVAEVQDGRPAGFRLFQMKDDSVFRRLGLQNGDVVQRVNGQTVSDPATLLALLQRLRTEPRVAIDVRRGAERRTMVYDVR